MKTFAMFGLRNSGMLFNTPDGNSGGEPQLDAWGAPIEEEVDPNNDPNLAPFLDMWEDNSATTGGNGNGATGNNAPATAPSQTPQNANPEEVLNNHFNSLGILNSIDFRGLMEQIQRGDDPNVLQNAFSQFGQGIYRHALTTANQLVDAKLEAAMQRINGLVDQKQFATSARQQLEAEFPQLNDPTIGPMFRPQVESAYAQFLKKNNGDTRKAVALTKGYINKMISAFGGNANPAPRPGSGGFGNGRVNGMPMQTETTNFGNSGGGNDWDALLGTPRRGR